MSRIRTPAILALTAVAVGFAASVSLLRSRRAPAFHGTDVGDGVSAHDFTLVSGDSVRHTLGEFRGKAVVLYFGYTTCPDVCPLTMSRLRTVMDRLGESREDVQVLLVTVDPDVDTPDTVDAYARRFDPTFIGLGGDRDALQAVARDYGVYASEPSAPAHRLEGHEDHGDDVEHGLPTRRLAHSSYIFGIAPDGTLRVLWGHEATADEIAEDLRVLLRL